ncbi:hypothetical protein [Urechidicola croceus]|uniref:DUF3575 domain-containing protein n=1 Tax=Urechidicola croceus TaxID=1850246 RepID=A0A1D8P9Z2_9FLAO|nr:hypothetical protein [Urechidicola croceus]AOW21394.1 hypothetical protein LPB138_12210 [Urechidicola croceus]
MKQIKITLIAFISLTTMTLNAQNSNEKPEEKQPKHEVGFDIAELIAYKKIEFSYNYLLNESESIGTNIFFFPDNDDFYDFEGYQENFSVDINYKHYFSKKYAQGFYIEALAKYNYGKGFKQDQNSFNYNPDDFKRYHELEVGFGIGYKYVSRRNFFIEGNFKVSRTIINSIDSNSEYSIPNVKPHFGISIGKRF